MSMNMSENLNLFSFIITMNYSLTDLKRKFIYSNVSPFEAITPITNENIEVFTDFLFWIMKVFNNCTPNQLESITEYIYHNYSTNQNDTQFNQRFETVDKFKSIGKRLFYDFLYKSSKNSYESAKSTVIFLIKSCENQVNIGDLKNIFYQNVKIELLVLDYPSSICDCKIVSEFLLFLFDTHNPTKLCHIEPILKLIFTNAKNFQNNSLESNAIPKLVSKYKTLTVQNLNTFTFYDSIINSISLALQESRQ